VHVDHLNTPRLVTDAAGTTVWRWDQAEPFGDSPTDENPSGLGAFSFPLRFAGTYDDPETNGLYNYFRALDRALGRYRQSDLIGLRGGINTYPYVGGSPLSFLMRTACCLGLLEVSRLQFHRFRQSRRRQATVQAAFFPPPSPPAPPGNSCIAQMFGYCNFVGMVSISPLGSSLALLQASSTVRLLDTMPIVLTIP
jgi:RHS repeat-associated protein